MSLATALPPGAPWAYFGVSDPRGVLPVVGGLLVRGEDGSVVACFLPRPLREHSDAAVRAALRPGPNVVLIILDGQIRVGWLDPATETLVDGDQAAADLVLGDLRARPLVLPAILVAAVAAGLAPAHVQAQLAAMGLSVHPADIDVNPLGPDDTVDGPAATVGHLRFGLQPGVDGRVYRVLSLDPGGAQPPVVLAWPSPAPLGLDKAALDAWAEEGTHGPHRLVGIQDSDPGASGAFLPGWFEVNLGEHVSDITPGGDVDIQDPALREVIGVLIAVARDELPRFAPWFASLGARLAAEDGEDA